MAGEVIAGLVVADREELEGIVAVLKVVGLGKLGAMEILVETAMPSVGMMLGTLTKGLVVADEAGVTAGIGEFEVSEISIEMAVASVGIMLAWLVLVKALMKPDVAGVTAGLDNVRVSGISVETAVCNVGVIEGFVETVVLGCYDTPSVGPGIPSILAVAVTLCSVRNRSCSVGSGTERTGRVALATGQ